MTKPTKKPGKVQEAKGENWIKIKTKKSEHLIDIERAAKANADNKKMLEEKGLKEVWEKDETKPRCWICKLVKI